MGREATQFKKGNCANPGGRPKISPELRKKAHLTKENLINILNDSFFLVRTSIYGVCRDIMIYHYFSNYNDLYSEAISAFHFIEIATTRPYIFLTRL